MLVSFWLWMAVVALTVVVVIEVGRAGEFDLVLILGGIAALQMVAALRMIVGRSWARAVLVAVAGKQIVAALRVLSDGGGHWLLHQPPMLALLIAAAVLLVVPASRPYFVDPS